MSERELKRNKYILLKVIYNFKQEICKSADN